MKLTTKSRYGMNAMYELAIRQGEGPVSLREIAESQLIPEPFLEQLMNKLRKAELVTSVRGAQGGYSLARDASLITVGEILTALEEDLVPVDCLLEEDSPCRSGGCAGRVLWERIYGAIRDLVDRMTLAELAGEYEKKQEKLNGSDLL